MCIRDRRERERERERERDRERDRQTDRQTNTETDGDRDRETQRQMETETDREREKSISVTREHNTTRLWLQPSVNPWKKTRQKLAADLSLVCPDVNWPPSRALPGVILPPTDCVLWD